MSSDSYIQSYQTPHSSGSKIIQKLVILSTFHLYSFSLFIASLLSGMFVGCEKIKTVDAKKDKLFTAMQKVSQTLPEISQ